MGSEDSFTGPQLSAAAQSLKNNPAVSRLLGWAKGGVNSGVRVLDPLQIAEIKALLDRKDDSPAATKMKDMYLGELVRALLTDVLDKHEKSGTERRREPAVV